MANDIKKTKDLHHLTFGELCDIFHKHNQENNITRQWEDKKAIRAVIVFKSSNWPDKEYTLEQRSYLIRSDEKYFIPEMGGNSIFSNCLDGIDQGVRLDWYMFNNHPHNWAVEYCYIKEN